MVTPIPHTPNSCSDHLSLSRPLYISSADCVKCRLLIRRIFAPFRRSCKEVANLSPSKKSAVSVVGCPFSDLFLISLSLFAPFIASWCRFWSLACLPPSRQTVKSKTSHFQKAAALDSDFAPHRRPSTPLFFFQTSHWSAEKPSCISHRFTSTSVQSCGREGGN